jgi:chloramphenicol-sensitive protein RarD
MQPEKIKGGLAAASTFLLWGVLPIYWKELDGVPPLEVVAHRLFWTSLLLVALLALTGRLGIYRTEFGSAPQVFSHLMRAALLGTNWLTYIWAVSHNRILEASLGYFLVPVVNVSLGVIFLKERLSAAQTVAVCIAAVGIGFFAVNADGLPWVALSLALTFGFYGLLRKRATVGALAGATIETNILLIFAVAWLVLLEAKGEGTFLHTDPSISLLLMGTGIITAIPLVLFGYCSRRISLGMIGIFQYLAPTAKFIIGLWVYHEPFTSLQMTGFILIWTALAIYSWSGLRVNRHRPHPILPE